MSDNPWSDRQEQLKDLLEKMTGSAVYLALFTEHWKKDPTCLVQLGYAIMLEKPLLFVVPFGTVVPRPLARIADALEYYDAAVEPDAPNGIGAATKRALSLVVQRELLGSPNVPRSAGNEEPWVVWSNEHNAWWGPGEWGYPEQLNDAGHYTRKRALEIAERAGPLRDPLTNRSFPTIPAEVAMSLSDAIKRVGTGDPPAGMVDAGSDTNLRPPTDA